MKASTKRWRKTNRSRFKSKAAFNRWQASRKKLWRSQNPQKYKAALARHKAYMVKYNRRRYATLRVLIAWEIIRRIKAGSQGDQPATYGTRGGMGGGEGAFSGSCTACE